MLDVVLAALLVMPTAGALCAADLALHNVTHTLEQAWAADAVELPRIIDLTVAEAQAAMSAAGLASKLADGQDAGANARVTAVTDSTGQIGYTGMGGEMVDPSDTYLIYTTVVVPAITEMVGGYYTGRTLTFEDGHSELEILKYGEVGVEDPVINTRGGTLQLAAFVKWNTEGAYQLASSEQSGLEQGDIIWGSSDARVAEVDQTTGAVQATGAFDGTVVITATLLRYLPSSLGEGEYVRFEIPVRVTGQRGDYVQEVVVVNEVGTALGESGIILDGSDPTAEYRPYVRVRYIDGAGNISYLVTSPYCGVGCVEGSHEHVASIDGLTWGSGGSSTSQSIVSIDPATGIVVPLPDIAGKVELVATVLGGMDGAVSGKTWVTVAGDTSAKPADALTVRVVYEMYPDEVASTMVYTPQTLASVGSGLHQVAYSQLKSDGMGGWRTVSGEGVYVKDILAALGVNNTDDLYGVRCTSTDGVQDFFVPAQVLLQPQYYFPSFDQIDSKGMHNINNGRAVEPMIATRSYWANDANVVDFDSLNGDNCFEMLLGQAPSITDEPAAHYSHYKIYEMTIVKRGAPAVRADPVVDGEGDPELTPPTIVGGQDAPGDGLGGNGDSGNGSGTTGTGTGTGDLDGDGGGDGVGQDATGKTVVSGYGDASALSFNQALAETGGQQSAASQLQAFADSFIEQASEQPEASERSWNVYQMMSKSQDALDLDYDNPLGPYVLPAIVLVVLGGAARSVLRYRKEMGSFFPLLWDVGGGRAPA